MDKKEEEINTKTEKTEEDKKEEEEDKEEDGEEGEEKKNNKSEKKVRKALGKLGMTKISGVNRVTVKPKDNNILIIKDAEVFSSKEIENTYIIFGELTFDEPDKGIAQDQLRNIQGGQTLKKEGEEGDKGKDIVKVEEEPEDPNAPVDSTGLDEVSIQSLMEEGKCSRAKAVKLLRKHEGDVVSAMLGLQS